MKRAIFAAVFCLAAAGTAAAADDSLAGLIQAGNRDAALKMIAAGADVNAAQGDGTTPLPGVNPPPPIQPNVRPPPTARPRPQTTGGHTPPAVRGIRPVTGGPLRPKTETGSADPLKD